MPYQGKRILVSLPEYFVKTLQQLHTQILPLQQKYSVRSSWEDHARPLAVSLCFTSLRLLQSLQYMKAVVSDKRAALVDVLDKHVGYLKYTKNGQVVFKYCRSLL